VEHSGSSRTAVIHIKPADDLENRQSPETDNSQNSPLAGMTYAKVSKHRTGWLGREDSNLRMVESKSGHFANDFKAHSEKIAKFDPR
jgi:hypothetical protein